MAAGAVSGSGCSMITDLGAMVIGGERLTVGQVLLNLTVSGGMGAAFAGIGYGLSKVFTALKVKIWGGKGGSSTVEGGGGTQGVRNINGQRTSKYRMLTDEEIASILDDIDAIGADSTIFKFNEGNQTGFLDSDGIINVRGDVLPDLSSSHPRDLMSQRAVLAHEYYGHKYFDDIFGARNPVPGS